MSDRLWLGREPQEWADVNLAECPSLRAAVIALQGLPGPRKVSGPEAEVTACRNAWREWFSDDDDEEVWLDPESVGWRIVNEA